MTVPDSVTIWIEELKRGSDDAARRLWQRYFRRLVTLARQQLRNTPRRVADEEDAVVSAFDSFCRAATAGRFPDLDDRHDLWRLLVVITERKAINQLQRARRLKRGAEKVRGESVFQDGTDSNPFDLTQFADHNPTPEFAAMATEECRLLLDALGDDQLRTIALLKLEGFTNEEIGVKLNRTTRTVERKLVLIRKQFEETLADVC